MIHYLVPSLKMYVHMSRLAGVEQEERVRERETSLVSSVEEKKKKNTRR